MSLSTIVAAALLAADPPAATPELDRIEVLAWIAPVPMPRSLPLTGEPGTDAFGYPLRVVDGAAFRSLFWHMRYGELTAYLEQLQVEFEADPRREEWLLDAAQALGSPESSQLKALDDWVRKTPDSFAPHLVRGMRWMATGWALRGGKYAAETSEASFAGMARAFERAEVDLRHALELRPKLAAARYGLLRIYLGGGKETLRREVLREALAFCPSCYQIRVAFIEGLLPRWGGSHEEMKSFARAALDVPNPRLRLLAGWIDLDSIATLSSEGRHAEALQAATRACELGEDWEFLLTKGGRERDAGDARAALQDLDRAAALKPGHPRVLFARARVYVNLHQYEKAARDVIDGLRIDPIGERVQYAFDTLVKGLVYEAWQHQQAGHLDDALRVYDLAADLAPTNRDVLNRRSFAITGASRRGPEVVAREQEAALDSPDDFFLQRRLSYILNGQKKHKDALELWARFLARQPQHGRAHLERATTLMRSRRHGEAINEALQACSLGTSEACGWMRSVIRPSK